MKSEKREVICIFSKTYQELLYINSVSENQISNSY